MTNESLSKTAATSNRTVVPLIAEGADIARFCSLLEVPLDGIPHNTYCVFEHLGFDGEARVFNVLSDMNWGGSTSPWHW